ncbi:MAG: Gldg family protein [Anaerolineae bacterium]|nr:Gldg family protein [Anaerolineae bacterium]
MKQALTITRKELRGYFGSPMALIFIGVFLAVTLFSFFWIDTFFARGIADVRPLFSWMPLLMIFLVAALTMRQWSEEQRSGTLEILLTLPVSTVQLVVGKFLAVLALVALSLGLTIFLPLTVELLGNLDWGPVVGGYLAALLLAGAYAAIGLFVSSRTDNQIVALISTVVVCFLLYIVGSADVTDFFGSQVGDILRAIGVGSRFESIQRGVIDLRDLAYYLSITGVFLTLNVLALKAKGWGPGAPLFDLWQVRGQTNGNGNGEQASDAAPLKRKAFLLRRAVSVTSLLLIINLIVVNVWAYPLRGLRVDITQYHEYTLSNTTRTLLQNLQEPLLIRGYFSEKTHPLLAPLVPTVRDMLKEYEVAGQGKVTVEIIDPATDPDKEAEANQVYGISPTPFQISGRYEASVINSYFDILIQYGDQSATLSFRDLIAIESKRDGSFDVRLENLEYDLTSNLKKVVYGFQNIDAILATFAEPVKLTVYVSPGTLPEQLSEVPATIEKVAQDIAGKSDGKFVYTIVDPTAADSPITPQKLYEQYGVQPYAVALFSDDYYYLHLILQIGDKVQAVYPSGELSEQDIRSAIESTLKRSSTGFLQVVGLWTPPATPTQDMFGQVQQPLSSWEKVRTALQQEYEVRDVDLSTGQVPSDISVLFVVGPESMDDKMLFAVDQYLMRGGAVILAAANYVITTDQMSGNLAVRPTVQNVQPLLAHYGITVENSLVLDPQNEPFPVPVMRQVGGFQVQEIQSLDYPFFVDVRSDGMASGNPIVSNLAAVTLNWVSPITVDETKNAGREVTVLLKSTEKSWNSSDGNVSPDMQLYPEYGFPVGAEQKTQTLAVAVQGVFESYFKGKVSPFEAGTGPQMAEDVATPEPTPQAVTGVIEESPESARLVVVGSAEFVDDIVFEISSMLSEESALNSLKLVQNAVAWATEDLDLLNIRARDVKSRILTPLTEREQSFWEYLNYGLALAALLVIAGVSNISRRNEEPLDLLPPQQEERVDSRR